MDMHIDLEGFREIQALLERAPDLTLQALHRATVKATHFLEGQVKERTPTGDLGALRESIFSETRISNGLGVTPVGVIGVVGTPLNYAIPVELGTRPHFPWDKERNELPRSLVDWVHAKLGKTGKEAEETAWLVARAISKRGTKGAFMFTETIRRHGDDVRGIYREAIRDVVQQLASGSAR